MTSKPDQSEAGGTLALYAVGTLEPLLSIRIPLKREDSIVLDIGQIYNQTIAGARVFRLLVDHAQPPVNFVSFHTGDQAKIMGLFGG